MKYLAVLGRQPEISVAELEALFGKVQRVADTLAVFEAESVEVGRLGGSLKVAVELGEKPLEFLHRMPEGKITLGVSDYTKRASRQTATAEALKLKKILTRQGRSVRVVENKDAVLSTATSLHNGLGGGNERKVELIRTDGGWYRVTGVQDIDAYARRDQARPARDARVGMLPPKLAQILINLCGDLPDRVRVLDPFCGTGVVLQEATLMGYRAYGTDIDERMVEYSRRNLEWLGRGRPLPVGEVEVGDATMFRWRGPIDAVACEGYLGRPMSQVPSEMKLKTEMQECWAIVVKFLKNLAGQIEPGVPVTMAIPAWLRTSGKYLRLDIIDEIESMGYNISNKSREGLLYSRKGQIVARDILILRKR